MAVWAKAKDLDSKQRAVWGLKWFLPGTAPRVIFYSINLAWLVFVKEVEEPLFILKCNSQRLSLWFLSRYGWKSWIGLLSAWSCLSQCESSWCVCWIAMLCLRSLSLFLSVCVCVCVDIYSCTFVCFSVCPVDPFFSWESITKSHDIRWQCHPPILKVNTCVLHK